MNDGSGAVGCIILAAAFMAGFLFAQLLSWVGGVLALPV